MSEKKQPPYQATPEPVQLISREAKENAIGAAKYCIAHLKTVKERDKQQSGWTHDLIRKIFPDQPPKKSMGQLRIEYAEDRSKCIDDAISDETHKRGEDIGMSETLHVMRSMVEAGVKSKTPPPTPPAKKTAPAAPKR